MTNTNRHVEYQGDDRIFVFSAAFNPVVPEFKTGAPQT